MNPNKKVRKPKLNIVEPGKSIRTKHNKPIENRIGWENGRSRKYPVQYPDHYIQASKLPVNINCVNKAEITAAVNPSNNPMYRTGKCGYRTRLGSSNTTESYTRRLDVLSKSTQSMIESDDPEIVIENYWTLSPNGTNLVVRTNSKDRTSCKFHGSIITKRRLTIK